MRKICEHIGAHEKINFIVGIKMFQVLAGYVRIACPALGYLEVGNFAESGKGKAAHFKAVADIVKSEPERRYVVASAPGKRFSHDIKVTDLLYKCYELANSDVDITEVFDEIKSRYNDIIKELKIDLCGVVHYENKASLNTFFRKEFAICGIYRQDSTYIFLYLLKKFDFLFENSSECVRINIRKIDAAEEALRRGMIGIGLDGDDLLFTKVSRKA